MSRHRAKPAPGPSDDDEAGDPAGGRLRLDKWLWAARFYKTRSLAVQAIEAGQARIGEERVKPAHPLRVGETVTIRKQGVVCVVNVTALADRRGSATVAATLYRETPQSIAAREAASAERRAAALSEPRFAGRPTKRDRRRLEDFLNEP